MLGGYGLSWRPDQIPCDLHICFSCLQQQEEAPISAIDPYVPVESVLQFRSVKVPKPLTKLGVREKNKLIRRTAPECNVALCCSLQKLLLMWMKRKPVAIVPRLGVLSGYRTQNSRSSICGCE